MTEPAESVHALAQWHAAVNAGDIDAAVACCDENVAVQGPRGVGHGHDLVRGWLTSIARFESLELVPEP